MSASIKHLKDLNQKDIQKLLSKYNLEMAIINDLEEIPGSFWGESEAGLIKNTLYVRRDTPIHSLLHESCHYICMDQTRRNVLNTNAGGNYAEENAVCYLQILLAEYVQGFGTTKAMQDMNQWGYTFRLGSAEAWFTQDADDAKQWLIEHNLITSDNIPTFQLRY